MKVCSLYGAGFYYIPGTDICMKLGGYVRYQVSTGVGNSISFGPFVGSGVSNNRATVDDVAQRVRVNFTMDTRQQTAYGTLRTYLLLGWTHDTPAAAISPAAPSVYFNRGFIQIAGFTFGKATSFFDFASTAAVAYNAGFLATSDTGDTGQIVAAYTAQFGNGMSATISMEQSRRAATANGPGVLAAVGGYSITGGGAFDKLGGIPVAGTASRPDFVANWRIDQAWGSAQIMGAIHDVSAAYYSSIAAGAGFANTFTELSNHPSDKWGWAAGVGIRLNAPMIGPGDYFQANAIYSEGAIKYAAMSGPGGNNLGAYWNGNTVGLGFAEDANFSGTAACTTAVNCPVGNSINLTTAWSVFASYEHFWTPALRTSLYGSYLDVSRNDAGNFNACVGSGLALGASATGLPGSAFIFPGTPCDANWSTWAIGSRSQWNVTKDFYVGVDVIYSKLNSMSVNTLGTPGNMVFLATTATAKPAGFYAFQDQDQVSVTWRVHRDIVP